MGVNNRNGKEMIQREVLIILKRIEKRLGRIETLLSLSASSLPNRRTPYSKKESALGQPIVEKWTPERRLTHSNQS